MGDKEPLFYYVNSYRPVVHNKEQLIKPKKKKKMLQESY